jgi:hypothetical protein
VCSAMGQQALPQEPHAKQVSSSSRNTCPCQILRRCYIVHVRVVRVLILACACGACLLLLTSKHIS